MEKFEPPNLIAQSSVKMHRLMDTVQAMLVTGKGLLAMDESIATCNQRFAKVGIAQTVEMRRTYRDLLLSAPGLSQFISGVIMVDETLRQTQADGRRLVQLAGDVGLVVGIKVDTGAKELAAHPDEKVTEGLDGLRERLELYVQMGARFAKWRAVFQVDDVRLPTAACIDANAHALARYAVLCQEAGLVPIIEAEVLMNGDHTLERCQEVTETVLRRVFCQLAVQGTQLEAMILKPNMVIAGLTCTVQNSAEQVADATLRCLRRVVPACVPGIMFLSGGQSGEEASSRLNAMQIRHGLMPLTMTADAATTRQPLPWPLSFSFARALQHPALEIWSGQERNRVAAQQALIQRAQCNSAALKGEYIADSQGRR